MRPPARRAAASAACLLWLSAPLLAQTCPDGTVAVAGGRCVKDMSRSGSDGPFMRMKPSFKGARCPTGTHTVESPIGFRCVMGSGDGDRPAPGRDRGGRRALPGSGPDPDAVQAPVPAAAGLKAPAPRPAPELVTAPDPQITEKVLASEGGAAPEPPPKAEPAKEFVPFRAKGLSLSVPRGWHVTDAWTDEIPTVYVELDSRRRGKPVTMLVSRLAPGQSGYEPLADALAKEKEYQGAEEVGARKVSGLAARATLVAGESRTVYVDAGDGAYYTLSFSAPKDVYPVYEPAFLKLLSSAKLGAH